MTAREINIISQPGEQIWPGLSWNQAGYIVWTGGLADHQVPARHQTRPAALVPTVKNYRIGRIFKEEDARLSLTLYK
jgi:hypothetical protein